MIVTNLSQLQLHGKLQCELDGGSLSILSAGRSIVVDISDMATGLQLLRLSSPQESGFRSLKSLKGLLDAAHMSLEVRLSEQTIVVLGYNRGTAFWRLFGFPALSLNLVAIAAAYIRDTRQ